MLFFSKSEKETQKIAGYLAVKIMRGHPSLPPSPKFRGSRKLRLASVVTLEGELGAGKTTFVKGFAKVLGIKAKIKSPTFVLMKKYLIHIPHSTFHIPKYLYHLDCYRVRDHKDLATLDLKSIFKAPENIVLIEWPERISKILPKKLIRVHIDHINNNSRKIEIS